MEKDKQPRLIVIAGPNGSGKTSITEQFHQLRHHWMQGCSYINPDQIAQEKYGDWNDPRAVLSAAQEADRLRELYLSESKDMAFETVLSTTGKLDFIKRAFDAGFFVRVFFVGTDHPRINAARIIDRMESGGHTVPMDKIVSRYYKSMANALKLASFVNRAYFYDNSQDLQGGVRPEWQPLFRTEEGRLVDKYSCPEEHLWAGEIYKDLSHL